MQKAQLQEKELSHEEIFEEQYSWLVRWALRFTEGNQGEAEDLVHDLFIQLVRLRPRIHSDSDGARGYLYTMLRNMHLSRLRRAQRSPICELLVVDYDSLEQGVRSVSSRSQAAVWKELWQICEYACERKKSSRSASVLILRFFLAYFPSEIAQILKTTRAPVDKYLHASRREARLCVSRPTTFRIFGENRKLREMPESPEDSQDFFNALRQQIFLSREGRCFSQEALQRVYTAGSSESLDTSDLAHLVSCPTCLDVLNQILGLRLLSDRCPSKSLGRDGGPPKGGGSGDGRVSISDQIRKAVRRLGEENEHRPSYLQVAVNGDITTSQKITSEFSEFYVKVGATRVLEFLEVFSEQDIRLLYLPASSLLSPARFEEETTVQLSDGRTLEVFVSFAADSPAIRVRYHDPLFSESVALSESTTISHPQAETTPERIVFAWWDLRAIFEQARSNRTNVPLISAVSALATAILVVAGITLLHHSQSAHLPEADLLQRASQSAATEVAPRNFVRRTILVQQLGSAGQLISEDSVEEWASGDSQNRARRLYDQGRRLVAEEITHGDKTKFYGRLGQKDISKVDPAHLQPSDVWQITPSAKQFKELTPPDGPYEIRQENESYAISYRNAKAAGGLLEVTLVLRRKDLHPVEEDLVLREDGRLRRYRLLESSWSYVRPSQIERDLFVPDERLSEARQRGSDGRATPRVSEDPKDNAALVIHAMYLLSLVKADMNGETTVRSAPNGLVEITGTISTPERLDEILRSLNPLRGRAGVDIHLKAADQLVPRSSRKSTRPRLEIIEPSAGAIPLDSQLRHYLTAQGIPAPDMEQAVQRFSRQVLENADEVQQHAWALDQLAKRFQPAQLSRISPQARWEWIQMVDRHSSALLRHAQLVRSQLTNLAPRHPVTPDETGPLTNIEDLRQASERLLKLSVANNRALGPLFTLSVTPGASDALNSADLWRSLGLVESLAREMARTSQILLVAGKDAHAESNPLR